MTASRAVISAPAHLHAGNIDLHGGLGRLYGTVGLTVSQPRLLVVVEEAGKAEVVAAEESRLKSYAEQYLEQLLREYSLPGARVVVRSEIPAMVGLGSRTPLALAIAAGLSIVYGARISLGDAALLLGRSHYTGLGYYSFLYGGLLVDAGFPVGGRGRSIPPLVYRAALPEKWRIVVALPEKLVERILPVKEREEEVLESMPRMSGELAGRAARVTLLKIMPAAAEARLGELLEGLYALNSGLGDYWAEKQGGRYCCREVEEAVEVLAGKGYPGLQSSWGPVVYTLAPDRREALRLAAVLREWLGRVGGGRVWVAAPDNRGAVVLDAAGPRPVREYASKPCKEAPSINTCGLDYSPIG